MADDGYTGYLFAFSHDDLDPSDGLQKTRIIAIAQSADEAMRAAGKVVEGSGFELLEAGADIPAQAREIGVADGKAAGQCPLAACLRRMLFSNNDLENKTAR